MAEVSFDAPNLVRQITIQATMTRHKQAMIRVRTAALIVRLAAWVGGFSGVQIIEDKARVSVFSPDHERRIKQIIEQVPEDSLND